MARPGPTVLLAPDKFKGSLTAAQVARAVGGGIRQVRPDAQVVAVPVADGGEGTLVAAAAVGFDLVPVTVAGPTGRPVATHYARHGPTAVVELADACGLTRLPRGLPAPLTASSRGAGEAVAAAVAAGCREVVIGMGGSASTDGGAGLLRALGARLLDSSGEDVPDGGAALAGVARLETERLRRRVAGVRFVVACDVDNPLTGSRGAAAVYGPQKGAGPAEVLELDDALDHWADLVARTTGSDRRHAAGAGAAGGVGFAAVALLGAQLRSGIDLVLDLVGFDQLLGGADLVVTGEGALDEQTLHGKAPAGIARAARDAGVPVVAVCGRSTLDPARCAEAGFDAAYSLQDLEPELDRCVAEAAALLEGLGARLARDRLGGCRSFAPASTSTRAKGETGA